MRASTLLVVLSSLGAHAFPLRPKSNETLARRDIQYSVVNVDSQPKTEVPRVVETITAVSPPQPPVTITITHTPTSPSSTPTPSFWSVGPLSTGIPGKHPQIVAREVNATAQKFLTRSASTNSTEAHSFVARQNVTESHLNTRSNSTATLLTRSNGTAGGLGARNNIVNSRLAARNNNTVADLMARSNSTDSHISARGLNISDRAVLYLRDALNATRVHDSSAVVRKSLNSTSLQPSN
ncbi:hypothetical protein BBP40_002669 [Aspergillus hancockii]|nr:hypothetical protein BBP40_002669 [Aspergillus hancockii]